MKISAINSRPDFRRDFWTHEIRVNGEIVVDAIFADTMKGEVVHFIDTPDGLKLNALGNGPDVAIKIGTVTISKSSKPVTERYSEHYLALFERKHKIVIPRAQ